MFGFEKLDVWQKAVEYGDTIYEITKPFPAEELFGLTSQLRRAAVSVSANIAEGSSRSSNIDFKRFIEIAYGSLLETVSELISPDGKASLKRKIVKNCTAKRSS